MYLKKLFDTLNLETSIKLIDVDDEKVLGEYKSYNDIQFRYIDCEIMEILAIGKNKLEIVIATQMI